MKNFKQIILSNLNNTRFIDNNNNQNVLNRNTPNISDNNNQNVLNRNTPNISDNNNQNVLNRNTSIYQIIIIILPNLLLISLTLIL